MIEITLPGIQKIRTQGNAADYKIEPLEPGYGLTIAHALQRVLMSSLPGMAAIALRVEQISGTEEDASDIALNIKQLRIRCEVQHPITIQLNVRGKRKVTAEDITVPDTIEIVNPDLHIATLSNDQALLALDLVIQKGRGYVPADVEPSSDMISLDAIYTPVRRAIYTIEHTRVGKMVNFDKIIFHIETDGTLHPDDAFIQSADILRRQFLVFTTYPPLRAEEEEVAAGSTFPIPQHLYHLPLENLHLPVRSNNSLKRSGITKVGQILSMNEDDLLGIRNIGETSIRDIALGLQAAHCLPPFVQDDAQTQ